MAQKGYLQKLKQRQEERRANDVKIEIQAITKDDSVFNRFISNIQNEMKEFSISRIVN